MSDIYKDYRPSGGNDLYIKLGDGDKIRGRIVSDPAISVYKEGDRPRYSWIILVRDFNGKEVNKPQILTKGVSVYNGIADLVDEWGDVREFDVAIKRTGSGLNDTEYSVTPVKTSTEPTSEQLEEIEKIDLIKSIKGKWLSKYMEDGQPPAPIMPSTSQKDTDDTFSEQDIPPDVE